MLTPGTVNLTVNLGPVSSTREARISSSLICSTRLASYAIMTDTSSIILPGFAAPGAADADTNPNSRSLCRLNLPISKLQKSKWQRWDTLLVSWVDQGVQPDCVRLVFPSSDAGEKSDQHVYMCVWTNRKCQDKVQVVQTQGNAFYSPKVNNRERYSSRWGLATQKHSITAVRASSIQCQVKEWVSQVNGQ